MFSAKLIKKKVEKAASTPAAKETATNKRKRKHGNKAPKVTTNKKQRGDSLMTFAAVSPHGTNPETDINKNKVTRTLRSNTNTKPSRKRETKTTKKKRKSRRLNNTDGHTDQPAHSKDAHEAGDEQSHPGTDMEGTKLVTQGADSGKGGEPARDSDMESTSTPPHQDTDAGDFDLQPSTSFVNSDSERDERHHGSGSRVMETQYTSLNQLGECLAATATDRGSVVAAVEVNTTLYIQGSLVVCPLLGSAEVLGCTLLPGQRQSLHSLLPYSLFGVKALEGSIVDPGHQAFQGLPSEWVEGLAEKASSLSIILLEFFRHSSPRVDFLARNGFGCLGRWENRDWQKPWHSIGATLVTRGNWHRKPIIHIPKEWKDAISGAITTWHCGEVPRVVVCGGKGVGKSTCFKYLANTLLTTHPDSAGILCLDFDPGQPELSLPSSLSLTHLTKPLLGPPYSHVLEDVSSHQTHLLVGAVSPQFVLEEYVAVMVELCREADELGRELPLLVNTMGWTQGTGLGLMLDVLRVVSPTHVMQIQSSKSKRNFPFPLHDATVSEARGGIGTRNGTHDLHYTLTLLPSVGQAGSATPTAQPRVLRDLSMLAEVGQAVEHGNRVTLPWSRVAMHVCQEQVPRDRILQVINAQLVALCRVRPANLHAPHQDLPQLLAPHAGFGDLLGWGVVMGVDPLAGTLQLATSLSPQVVTERVNALVMPRMHLPTEFYKLYCVGKAPYLEKMKQEGLGRLRVGRRIKPRGHKD